jgi:hypothetical protein
VKRRRENLGLPSRVEVDNLRDLDGFESVVPRRNESSSMALD